MTILHLNPQDILFTQDSISDVFGKDKSETVERTFMQLLYGEISPDKIKLITVMIFDENYWVVSGNRRLYVYRQLAAVGRFNEIPVKVEPLDVGRFFRMKSTKNQGQSVLVRTDKSQPDGKKIQDLLDRIVTDWTRKGKPTSGFIASWISPVQNSNPRLVQATNVTSNKTVSQHQFTICGSNNVTNTHFNGALLRCANEVKSTSNAEKNISFKTSDRNFSYPSGNTARRVNFASFNSANIHNGSGSKPATSCIARGSSSQSAPEKGHIHSSTAAVSRSASAASFKAASVNQKSGQSSNVVAKRRSSSNSLPKNANNALNSHNGISRPRSAVSFKPFSANLNNKKNFSGTDRNVLSSKWAAKKPNSGSNSHGPSSRPASARSSVSVTINLMNRLSVNGGPKSGFVSNSTPKEINRGTNEHEKSSRPVGAACSKPVSASHTRGQSSGGAASGIKSRTANSHAATSPNSGTIKSNIGSRSRPTSAKPKGGSNSSAMPNSKTTPKPSSKPVKAQIGSKSKTSASKSRK